MGREHIIWSWKQYLSVVRVWDQYIFAFLYFRSDKISDWFQMQIKLQNMWSIFKWNKRFSLLYNRQVKWISIKWNMENSWWDVPFPIYLNSRQKNIYLKFKIFEYLFRTFWRYILPQSKDIQRQQYYSSGFRSV